MYKGTPIRLSADFSAENLQTRRECYDIFKVWMEKFYNLGYFTQQGYHSELKEK